jgi:hypothetical protein
MPDNALLSFLEERGEDWIRWTPDTARASDLAAAVEAFEPVDRDAGHRAAEWLKTDALRNHGSTVTYLMVVGGRLEAFYAICSAQVRLTQRDRPALRSDEEELLLSPVQPASLLAWLGKHRDAEVDGHQVLLHALGTAQAVAELQGNIAFVLDPYDEQTADFWQRRYGFRRSQEELRSGLRRLWMPLLPPPDYPTD